MKKLIAILVVFALAMGAAFAEVTVGGGVHVTIEAANGTDEQKVVGADKNGLPVWGKVQEDAGYGRSDGISRSRIELSGASDDEAFGGWLRYDGLDVGANVLAWWQPIDAFKLSLGGNPDGHFGKDGLTRWGFYATAGDLGVAKEGWRFGDSFFGGWGEKGAILTITPTDMIEVNLGIPFISGAHGFKKSPSKAYKDTLYIGTKSGYKKAIDDAKAADPKFVYSEGENEDGKVVSVYMASTLQVAANMDFGTIALTVAGLNENGKIYVYYGGSPIENLDINFGVGFNFGKQKGIFEYLLVPDYDLVNDADGDGDKDDSQYLIAYGERKQPIAVGLGVGYAITDEFNIKARFQVNIAQESGEKLAIDFGLHPSYKVSDNVTAHLGFDLFMQDKVMTLGVYPYVEVAGMFFAGVKILQANKDATGGKAQLAWSIPIGIAFGF